MKYFKPYVRFFAVIGLLALVAAGIFARQSSVKSDQGHVLIADKVLPEVNAIEDEPEPEQPAVSSDVEATSPVPSGTQSTNSNKAVKDITVAPPSPAPFLITSVKLEGVFTQCNNPVDLNNVITIYDAFAITNSPLGGQVTYFTEVEGSYSPIAPYSQTVIMQPNSFSMSLKIPGAGGPGPQAIYTTGQAKVGERVRIHVTSPNNVVSAWTSVC